MVIQKLNNRVQSLIHAGPIVTDATQCVLELVYNALDANAKSIAVRVNLNKFYIQVVDNGTGISEVDFCLVGEKYVSSKCCDEEQLQSLSSSFGYRGCALAAISRTCTRMDIQTRHCSGTSTYSKIIERGVSGPIQASNSVRPVPGTTVTVEDAFISLPVRRRRIRELFDLDDIIHQLESLAVIFNQVSFSLRNDSTGKVLLQTHRQDDLQPTLGQLFGLAENSLLLPVNYRQENVSVTGHLCSELHSDCSLQLVYINHRLVDKTKIHKLIIALLKKHGQFWEKDRKESDIIVDTDGYVFIINVQLPYQSFSLERSGRTTTLHLVNAEEILRTVHRAVKGCLKGDHITTSGQNELWVPGESLLQGGVQERAFGPSQLQLAVCGQQATRRVPNQVDTETVDVSNCPQLHGILVHDEVNLNKDNMSSKDNNQVTESNKVSQVSRNNRRDHEPSPSVNESCASDNVRRSLCPNMYFYQNSTDETGLAEQAPIYEIDEFLAHTFHDFISWLKIKANSDCNAKKLFAEFISFKEPNKCLVYNNKPAPITSLRQIRQEKLQTWTKEMLKKIQLANENNKMAGLQNNGSYSQFSSVKRAPAENHGNSYGQSIEERDFGYSWPQVSFKEFMAWLKLKVKSGDAATQLLREFSSFKRSRSHLKRKSNTLLLNFEAEKSCKENSHPAKAAMRPPKTPKLATTEIKKLSTGAEKCVESFLYHQEKRKKNRKTSRQEEVLNEMESPLLCTWKSHYRSEQRESRKGPSTKSSKATKVIDIPSNSGENDGELSVLEDVAAKKKDVPTHIAHHSPHIRLKTKDVSVQACVHVADRFSQTKYRQQCVEKAVQTEPQQLHKFCDFATQTSQKEQKNSSTSPRPQCVRMIDISEEDKPSSSDLPCGQRMSETSKVSGEIDSNVPMTSTLLKNNASEDMMTPYHDGLSESQRNQILPAVESAQIYCKTAQTLNTDSNFLFCEAHSKSICKTKEVMIEQNSDVRSNSMPNETSQKYCSFNPPAVSSRLADSLDEIKNLPDTAPADPLWEPRADASGEKYYVHSISGCSTFMPPASSTRSSFAMKSLVGGVAIGAPNLQPLSVPSLQVDDFVELQAALTDSCEDYLNVVKWQSPQEEGENSNTILTELQKCSDVAGYVEELCIPNARLPKREADILKLIDSFLFTAEDISTAKVIGQLDKKFIAAIMRKPAQGQPGERPFIVCLFDQHAVDERITYERLFKQYYSDGKCARESLQMPLELVLAPTALSAIRSAPHQFRAHGLHLSPKGEHQVVVTEVPMCFIQKQSREPLKYRNASMRRMVLDLVIEVTEHLTDTRGSGLSLPNTLHKVIASQACRSAIKFNQTLKLIRMSELLMELANCQLPFQCAHGRPTVVPIIELQQPMAPGKVNLKKFKRT